MARCSVEGSRFWFNCNPESPGHWFYTEWVQQAERRNMLHLHFTMEDNLALPAKIRKRYEGLYSGVFYDRYIRGLWVAAEGRIYDCFDEKKHTAAKLPELAGDQYVSSDYGTQNATVFLLWQRERGKERWVYYSPAATRNGKKQIRRALLWPPQSAGRTSWT